MVFLRGIFSLSPSNVQYRLTNSISSIFGSYVFGFNSIVNFIYGVFLQWRLTRRLCVVRESKVWIFGLAVTSQSSVWWFKFINKIVKAELWRVELYYILSFTEIQHYTSGYVSYWLVYFINYSFFVLSVSTIWCYGTFCVRVTNAIHEYRFIVF